jgi:hypothetical protein
MGRRVPDCVADVAEVALDKLLTKLSVAELDLLVEAAGGGVLEDHIGGVLLLLVVVVEQLDDVGVVQFMVHVDLLLRILVVDLTASQCTILIATTSPFSVFRASFTSPYDPNPTIYTFPVSFFRN